MLVRLEGRVMCAPPARAYDFIPEGEDARLVGTTRQAWIVQAFGVKPVIVQFSDDHAADFETLRERYDVGDVIAMMVDSGYKTRFAAWAEVGASA